MIKVIIFDVGGVIIDFTEDQYISYLSKRVKINQSRLRRVLYPLIVTMDYGRMDLDHAEKIFADHFNIQRSKLEWVEAFKRLAKPNKNVVSLIKRLSENYKIGIITNITKSRYREARGMALNRLIKPGIVKTVVASCYVGMRKPSSKIYTYTLRKMRCKAKDVLFIDNQIENVIGARKVGIQSIQFKNYKQLVADLRKMKVS